MSIFCLQNGNWKIYWKSSTIRNKTINKLQKVEKPLELYAYTPNKYLDEMRFVKTEGPIPVDPDFFI